uniref:Uncharacterized protein n=1 Tax=Burkholderia sp. M701 TaxID=326454 RepID=V5YPF0_9BURK|nr:hypothetical protein [Burkholderia sp. M701]
MRLRDRCPHLARHNPDVGPRFPIEHRVKQYKSRSRRRMSAQQRARQSSPPAPALLTIMVLPVRKSAGRICSATRRSSIRAASALICLFTARPNLASRARMPSPRRVAGSGRSENGSHIRMKRRLRLMAFGSQTA